MKRRVYIVTCSIAVVTAAGLYAIQHQRSDAPANRQQPTTKQNSVPDKEPATPQPTTPSFNKERYSLEDPSSPWAVINKRRPLKPVSYVPSSLVVPNVPMRSNITSDERQLAQPAATALEALLRSASKQQLSLPLQSGYRSYNFQVNLYNRYVNQQGRAVADTQSARAGHSEHQTGLAADLGSTTQPSCNVEVCFKDTPEGKWLAAHAHEFGFIIRYPEGKTPVTGYMYEPWHVRYVGTELATEMHIRGIVTLEEFFGLPSAPDYN